VRHYEVHVVDGLDPRSTPAPFGEQGSGPEVALSSTEGHGLVVGAGAARTIGAEEISDHGGWRVAVSPRKWAKQPSVVGPRRPRVGPSHLKEISKLDHYCHKAILTNQTYV